MGAGVIADVAGQSVVPGAGLESLYAAVAWVCPLRSARTAKPPIYRVPSCQLGRTW